MKINNINISNYSAELLDRQVSTQNIDSITNWFAGSNNGNLLRQTNDFKSILLTFLIKEETEDAAFKKISKLTEELKKCEIVFDDINLTFSCYLESSAKPVRVQNSVFKVVYLLKNDWATGNAVSTQYSFNTLAVKTLKLEYVINWGSTVGHYTSCFEDSDLYQTIAKEEVCFAESAIDEALLEAEDWVSLFLLLGIDINKYKPDEGNTLYGFPYITTIFSPATAKATLLGLDEVKILYNRFSVDDEPDLPKAYYPSVVLSIGADNDYYFNLGAGSGWDSQDTSIIIEGRYFYSISDNGPLFGSEYNTFRYKFTNPNLKVVTNINDRNFKVYNSTSTGGSIVVETLESISDVPIRKHGLKSSVEGVAGNRGYVDVIFNGVTLDRVPADGLSPFTSNIFLLRSGRGSSATYGSYCEITRVQLYHNGELIKDYVPINCSLKNGFDNTYDVGLYDVNDMKFIPWKKSDGTTGLKPPTYLMPIPQGSTPTPPTPVVFYNVSIISGSGSGSYAENDTVSIVANEILNKRFTEWTTASSGVVLVSSTSASTSFIMPANDVEISANYENLYSVSIVNGSGDGSYGLGDIVTITADTAPSGKRFSSWTTSSPNVVLADSTSSTTTFTMPANEVVITATYEDLPVAHTVTVTSGSGGGSYYSGDTVTIKANAAPTGKVFSEWTTSSPNVTFADDTASTTTFVMPDHDVTVTATYENIPVVPEILLYKGSSYIESETIMGTNNSPWATSYPLYTNPIYEPRQGQKGYYIVYSVPDASVTYFRLYDENKMHATATAWDKWHRFCILFDVTTSTWSNGQYITMDLSDGNSLRVDFVICPPAPTN